MVPRSTQQPKQPQEKTLNLIVTSGGTRVLVDGVRAMTNTSRGTTGALIAEDALERGHKVHYLYAQGAKTPFGEEFVVDKFKVFDPAAWEAELERIRRVGEHFREVGLGLKEEQVRDFYEYQRRLLELVKDQTRDVTVLCMAASDYGPDKVEGKISSELEDFDLTFHRLPKIISAVKRERHDIFLVGFKFLLQKPPDALIETAYRSMLRDRQDLCVANAADDSIKYEQLKTYIVTNERGILPVTRDQLAPELVRLIQNRHSRRYYRTDLVQSPRLPVPEDTLNSYLCDVRRLSGLALFGRYLEGSREEFGFLASRTEAGTMITGRGSSKSDCCEQDVALVTDLDQEQRIIRAVSTGKKASLNAPLAHLIFALRPDIQHIVHSHILLPGSAACSRETSPGTAEDWEIVQPLIERGEQVIHQPLHGSLILLKDLAELPALLEGKGVYQCRPELYDVAYRRFQKNDDFVDLVSAYLPTTARVLDLAAGTGEVTRGLLSRGFTQLTLADQSAEMLRVAKAKLPELTEASFHVQCMENAGGHDPMDGVCIRQAINYIAPAALPHVFQRIREILAPGGKLFFNTFTADPAAIPRDRFSREETEGAVLLTQEGNLVEQGLVYHGQRTEVFDKTRAGYEQVYDLNVFHLLPQNVLLEALQGGGFSQVQIHSKGKGAIYVCSR